MSQNRHDLLTRFRRAVRRAPDRPAVIGADGVVTLAELDTRTRQAAAALRGRGIGHRVGVCLPRGSGLVAALLGVWRAGAAYVPLDPAYPAERLAFMARDAGIEALLCAAGDPPAWAAAAGVDTLACPDVLETPAPDDVELPPELPAYVIYTSGSTGRPKGVEITHGCVASLVAALEAAGAYGAEPRVVGWNASVSFDASVKQWVRVCRGDTVVVVDDALRTNPPRLRALLDEWGVTDLDLTPTHWEILRRDLLAPFPDGRVLRLFMGGEAISERTWREIAAAEGIAGLNVYGPTECTVDSTLAWMEGTEPHLGRPLPGAQIHVLDEALRPVPADVTGELYIGGARLATGYVNRPGATARRFLPDPFAGSGRRMYRTGDLVRRTADGLLAFVGRADRQVKARGFRIELGDIEHHVATHPDVARAAVVMRAERLVAYLLPAGDRVPSAEQLRDYVAARLPEFMVPSKFVALAEFPVTHNGKLDLAALAVDKGGNNGAVGGR